MSWPAGLALSAIAAVVVAWAARRLLGAQRVSAARTLIAAVVGITVGWVVGVLVSRGDVPVGEAAVTGAILAVLVTMFVIVGFELAARPRRDGDTGRERRNPLRAARDRWADTRRLTEIARIARGHGLFTAATRGMAPTTTSTSVETGTARSGR